MVSLYTTQTPNLTNENDGAPGYMLGGGMYFTEPGQITAVRFYATSSVGGDYEVAVYQVTGADDDVPSGTLLDNVVLGSPPTPGAWNEVPLNTPITVTPNTVLYRPVLRNSQGRYTALTGLFSSAGLTNGPIVSWQTGTDPIGIGAMRNGVLSLTGAVLNYPSAGAPGGTSYLIDVVFEPDGEDPAEGSADIGLNLSLAATGAADAEGSAALDLGLALAATGAADAEGLASLDLGLALAASGAVQAQGQVSIGLDLALAVSGDAPDTGQGTADFPLDLTLAASGARDSLGVAALGLGLALSVTGSSGPSQGQVALGLNLALAASGSDGEAGCPVPSFPWSPRAVRSFPEGSCS